MADETTTREIDLRVDARSVAYVVVAILAAFALFAVARSAADTLTRLGIGVVLALALDPVTSAVRRRLKCRRLVAVALVAVTVLAVAIAVVVFVGPPAVRQARRFNAELPETVRQFQDLPVVGRFLERNNAETRVTEWVDNLPSSISDETVARTIDRMLTGAWGFVVVLATTLAVLIDGPHFVGRTRRLFRRHEDRAVQVGRVLYETLGQYFAGSVTVALMMGLFVLTLGLILGVPLAPLAAMWAMLTDLIPQVGGALGGGFFVVLALAKGPGTALLAGGLFVIYMNLENYVITPAIVGQTVNLTPPTTMLAAFIGGAVAGIPGALVATPLVGTAKRLYLLRKHGKLPEPPSRQSIMSRLTARFSPKAKTLAP